MRKEELEPVAAEIDAEHRFPEENFAKMAKVGFTGIGVPEQYGGSGGGMLEKVIAVSEFAKKCMASAATLSIHPYSASYNTRFRYRRTETEISAKADKKAENLELLLLQSLMQDQMLPE